MLVFVLFSGFFFYEFENGEKKSGFSDEIGYFEKLLAILCEYGRTGNIQDESGAKRRLKRL